MMIWIHIQLFWRGLYSHLPIRMKKKMDSLLEGIEIPKKNVTQSFKYWFPYLLKGDIH